MTYLEGRHGREMHGKQRDLVQKRESGELRELTRGQEGGRPLTDSAEAVDADGRDNDGGRHSDSGCCYESGCCLREEKERERDAAELGAEEHGVVKGQALVSPQAQSDPPQPVRDVGLSFPSLQRLQVSP